MNSFIGTKEAARRLNISIRRVQALIVSGRLAAARVGNSYAIRESDLTALNGRKNGRPKPRIERTQEEWEGVLDRILGRISPEWPESRKEEKKREIVIKSTPKRTQEEWDAIIDKFAGSVSLGPSDLSTNKKYLEGLGRDKVFRR